MAQPLILPSFAAGEIAPSLYARVDLAKYHVGAALLRNMFVDYRGGASNRTGSMFVADSLDASEPTRLIPFIFSTLQAYVLVFSHFKMQVVMNGGLVIDGGTGLPFEMDTPYDAADLALLKFSQSADVMTLTHPSYTTRELTRTAHDAWTLTEVGFAPTQQIVQNVAAVASMTGDGTQYLYVVTSIGSNGLTESLPSAAATVPDSKTMSVTLGAYQTISWDPVPGAQLYNVYRTPEVAGGSPSSGQFFGFVGSSNGTSFVDSNIAPDFSRTPPQSFNPFLTPGFVDSLTITQQSTTGLSAVPTLAFSGGGGSGAAGVLRCGLAGVIAGVIGSAYKVGDVLTAVGGTFDTPGKIEVTAIDGAGGIIFYSIVTPGEYSVLPAYPITFTGGSGTGFTAANAAWTLVRAIVTNGGTDYTSAPTVAVTGGSASGAAVVATINVIHNNPSVSTYYQQRQVFAATFNQPQSFWMSKSGDFHNMGFSSPARADDSIIGTLASLQVNAIKFMVPMQSLIMLSSSGAWKVDAGQPGLPLTPSSIQALPQAYNGCADVPPIIVNYDILYVQAKGAVVRDLAYNFYVNIFTGADMTVLANHLFYGHQIKEWAYAEEPFKVIWAVREDGVLLSFTFLKEQDVYAWAHHDTQGRYRSVAVIPEGNEDAVYVVVERYISGTRHQYIERMASRNMGAVPEQGIPADLAKAWFVDAGLQYPLTYPAAQLTPSDTTAPLSIASAVLVAGGSGYVAPVAVITDRTGSGAIITLTVAGGVITGAIVVQGGTNYTNPTVEIQDSAGTGAVVAPQMTRDVVMDADAGVFVAADVGAMVRINHGWGTVRVLNSPSRITVNVLQELASAWPAASGEWSCTRPVSSVSGLGHLEGEEVAILADGNVMPRQRVHGGSVTLQSPASAIFVGLPFVAQFQTLYIDTGEMPTVQGKRKRIPAATLRVQDSRGVKVGTDFEHLRPMKERTFEPMGSPILPITGDERVLLNSDWDVQGQVCAQQDNPLPLTILGVIPELVVGDN